MPLYTTTSAAYTKKNEHELLLVYFAQCQQNRSRVMCTLHLKCYGCTQMLCRVRTTLYYAAVSAPGRTRDATTIKCWVRPTPARSRKPFAIIVILNFMGLAARNVDARAALEGFHDRTSTHTCTRKTTTPAWQGRTYNEVALCRRRRRTLARSECISDAPQMRTDFL